MKLRAVGIGILVLAGSLWGQSGIHWKVRHDGDLPLTRNTGRARPGTHYVVQFASFPGADVRQELGRRHVRILGYLPDSALMVSAAGAPDFEGLDVVWSGPLDPAYKISPALSSVTAAAYLVIFHPDVDMIEARTLVQVLGFDVIANPSLLPQQLLVTGDDKGLGPLSECDEVAYIMPASPDLIAGNPVMGCAGPLTESGPVAEYVTVSNGWSKDSSGVVSLQYFFQSITDKLDQATVESEIERAFREWQKYANITLTAGAQADAVRTIAIQFARGAHGDAYPFDGPGGVLAHTFYPAPPNTEPIASDMHFDADENWNIGTNTDVFSVALHEAGHALGLGHSDQPGAVMYPYYRLSTGLTSDDISGIQAIYGAASSAQPPATPTAPPATPPATPPSTPPATPPSTPPSTPPATPPSKPPVTDTTPPSLTIASPGSTIVSTTSATLHCSGTAKDDVGVTAVKWSTSSGDAGVASGTTSWSADIPLLVGNTVVTVRAYDAAGNSGWRAVTVVRH